MTRIEARLLAWCSGVARIVAAAGLAAAAIAALPAHAQQGARSDRVQVTDPYLDMHTGPGRGYPVFHVAARDEWVEIVLRFTDWYKVRTVGGKEGWVHRRQLATTLTALGERTPFRDLVVDDFLARKLEFGGGWGQFKSEPMLKLWTAYRLAPVLSVEGTVGQVQGVFSGTELWHINLHAEPWADQRWSPFFGVGFGRFKNFPNTSLVDADVTDARLSNAMIGLRFFLTDRFVVRADYTFYTAFLSDNRSTEYRAITAGLSFFF
jgi:hypothetical protein